MNTTVLGAMPKKPYKRVYHVFSWDSDGHDDWYSKYSEAVNAYERLCKSLGDMRLYEEIYYSEDSYEDGEPDEENCLKYRGSDETV